MTLNCKGISNNYSYMEKMALETNVLFLYGKKVADLHAINKDTIWTTATAALQEVDRQLQAEKIKTLKLTSRLESLEARIKESK